MSIAAMTADSGRPGSFLPAIKCSNCGDEIEIARMGQHLCGPGAHGDPPMAPPTRGHSPNMSNPFTLRNVHANAAEPPLAMPTPLQYGGQLPPASSERVNLPAPAIPGAAQAAVPAPMPMPAAQSDALPSNPYSQPPPPREPPFRSASPVTQYQHGQPPPPREPFLRSASPASQQQHGQLAPVPRVRAPTLPSGLNPVSKPPRTNLPRINPDAANRPFLAPRPTLDAPPSPAVSTRSAGSNGRSALSRGATSPMPRLWDPRPPSPELSANLDCAFPPFPSAAPPPKKERRPSASQSRRTPAPSERAPSRGGSRLDQVMNAEPEPFNLPPQSPTKATPGAGPLPSMNLLNSGPLGALVQGESREPRDEQTPSAPAPGRPSVSAVDAPQLPTTASSFSKPRRPSMPSMPSVPAAPSAAAAEFMLSNATYSAARKTPPARPERPQESELSPSFLSSFSAEPLSMPGSETPSQAVGAPEAVNGPHDRSQSRNSNQSRDGSHTLPKMRSEPSLQERIRRPSMPGLPASDPSRVPQLQQLPPRGDSRNGNRMDARIQNAPPVPKPVQQRRQDSSKHSPSASGSSTSSASPSIMNSTNSSTMSPVGSAASSVEAFSPLNDLGKYAGGDDDRLRVDGAAFNKIPLGGGALSPIAEQPRQILPPRNFARPAPPRDAAQRSDGEPMDTPVDHVQQQGRLPPGVPGGFGSSRPPNLRPFPLRTHTAPGPSVNAMPAPLTIPADRPNNGNFDPYKPMGSDSARPPTAIQDSLSPEEPINQDAMQPPRTPTDLDIRRAPPPSRRGTISGKGAICRGCNRLIEGKSVKAADGRLTGRWHKACFVCRSCRAPFTTADFYVIADQPYCEQHYHERNGSLCAGCGRGIEGQYTETTSSSSAASAAAAGAGAGANGGSSGRLGPGGAAPSRKYHPRCFTCRECRAVLEEDYFEIRGSVFCERHALAAMRAQARLAAGQGGSGGPGTGPGGFGPLDRRGLMAERRTTKLMMMNAA